MKNIILIILSVFIFVGCAPKKEVSIFKQEREKQDHLILSDQDEEVKIDTQSDENNIVSSKNIVNKVAIIYPSKIVGKYAKSTIGTISAYFIYKNEEFQLETFDTSDENVENILSKFELLEEKGFSKVIALFTENGFNALKEYNELSNLKIYFPLINKKEIITENENFIFGGISYEEQLDLLNALSSEKTSMFYVESYIGNKLKTYYENTFENTKIIKEIKRKNNRYKYIMNDEKMIGSTVLLNTPIIKSSIIMSQLTAYEIEPIRILSTQLNYNPLLMKLTQTRDRTNFLVVNSIAKVNDFLIDYTNMLGSDISYNWVDYSSLVGVDYLVNINNQNQNQNQMTDILNVVEEGIPHDIRKEELIKSKVKDSQVIYEPVLYRGTSYGFEKVESTLEN